MRELEDESKRRSRVLRGPHPRSVASGRNREEPPRRGLHLHFKYARHIHATHQIVRFPLLPFSFFFLFSLFAADGISLSLSLFLSRRNESLSNSSVENIPSFDIWHIPVSCIPSFRRFSSILVDSRRSTLPNKQTCMRGRSWIYERQVFKDSWIHREGRRDVNATTRKDP